MTAPTLTEKAILTNLIEESLDSARKLAASLASKRADGDKFSKERLVHRKAWRRYRRRVTTYTSLFGEWYWESVGKEK